jgi:hypothetical protein
VRSSALRLPPASVDSSTDSFSSSAQFSCLGICPAGPRHLIFLSKPFRSHARGRSAAPVSARFFSPPPVEVLDQARASIAAIAQFGFCAQGLSAAAFAKSATQFHVLVNFLLPLRCDASASCSSACLLFLSRSSSVLIFDTVRCEFIIVICWWIHGSWICLNHFMLSL